MKRLRVLHFIVQPVLVWDDGEKLTPEPNAGPVRLNVDEVAGFIATLPEQLAEAEAAALAAEAQSLADSASAKAPARKRPTAKKTAAKKA